MGEYERCYLLPLEYSFELLLMQPIRVSIGWNNANVDLITVALSGLALFTLAVLLGMLYAALVRRHMNDTMGLHEHNDAFAIMEDKAERFCDCCRSPLACIFGTLTAILLIRSFPSFNLRVVGLWVIWLNNRNNLPMFLLLRQVLVLGRITGFLVGSPLHSFG